MSAVPKSTSSVQNYRTPRAFFRWVNSWFNFTLDAAAEPDNALCPRYLTATEDAFKTPWVNADGSPATVWLNPTFYNIAAWMERAEDQCLTVGATSAVLVPAALETEWCKRYATRAADVAVFRPRLPYVYPEVPRNRYGKIIPPKAPKSSAKKSGASGPPIASMLVVFRPEHLRAENDDFHATLMDIPTEVMTAVREEVKAAAARAALRAA